MTNALLDALRAYMIWDEQTTCSPMCDTPQYKAAVAAVAQAKAEALERSTQEAADVELATAVGRLSTAMGSPAVYGKWPRTVLSATVDLAAARITAEHAGKKAA